MWRAPRRGAIPRPLEVPLRLLSAVWVFETMLVQFPTGFCKDSWVCPLRSKFLTVPCRRWSRSYYGLPGTKLTREKIRIIATNVGIKLFLFPQKVNKRHLRASRGWLLNAYFAWWQIKCVRGLIYYSLPILLLQERNNGWQGIYCVSMQLVFKWELVEPIVSNFKIMD